MQAGSARAVEREPAKQHDAGDIVLALSEASSREVMVHESLREETAKKTLYDPMVKVELDHAVIDAFGGGCP